MNVAYMLDLFPVFSETFIVREILELRRNGFNVLVFAQRNTTGSIFSEVVHADHEKLMRDVHYHSSLLRNRMSKLHIAIYHLYFLVLNPIRYLRTFRIASKHSTQTFRLFQGSVLYAMKFKRARIGHIHAHFALEASQRAMLVSMLTGIPYSFTVHAHDIFVPDLSDLVEDKFNRAKFVACISEYNKNYILQNYPAVDPGNIRIIHCGIDCGALIPGSKDEHRKFTILAIGRLVEHKGFKYLIRACKALMDKQGLDFVCKIIGEGKDRPELEKLISESDLTGVIHLLGAMEQADVIEALRSAHVFVLPCVIEKAGYRDGIPVSLMEAMALGIPVVSTRVSGVPELVKDGGGILVEPKDAYGLAMAIEKIFRLQDKERAAMGRKGRAIVEEDFNLQKETHKLAELFTS